MTKKENEIMELIHNYENQKKTKTALSKKFPQFKKQIIFVRHVARGTKDSLNFKIGYKKGKDFFKFIIARHQSVLRRKLGNSDPELQESKVVNLKQAVSKLNGVIIKPGQVFSFWKIIGKPNYKNGYVDGMLLSNGKVVRGVGGGLCQLSNFLYWIFLHAPIETVERYHHSMDVFPDSGRVLPFGSGATILYNFVDLKFKNTSKWPFQLKIWVTDTHLKGQVLSLNKIPEKLHVYEKNHCFVKRGDLYFRYNEIYRETKINGKREKIEKITTNFAPTLYGVTKDYILKNNFKVLDFTNK